MLLLLKQLLFLVLKQKKLQLLLPVNYKNKQKFVINMNRNCTAVKKLMWLPLIEMLKEVQDIKGKEMCTDRALRNILYEMASQHYILLCDGLFVLC